MVQLLQANVSTGTDVSSRGWLPNRHLWPLIAACIAVLACAHDLYAQVSYAVVADLSSIGGAAPLGGVIRGADGALYGTTSEGGAENCGIVYRIDAAGVLSRIHEFSQPDGCLPAGELALGPDGSLYGVTNRGGDADPQRAAGTIYKLALDGTFTVLHRFVFPTAHPEPWLVPSRPYASLTLAPDGFFYGTTMSDDVFRISPDGAFSLVHQFVETGNGEPLVLTAALVAGADDNLYSISRSFSLIVPRAGGTVFRVSLAGDAEVLRRFFIPSPFNVPPGIPPSPEGIIPEGELAGGPDGEFYGANSTLGPSLTGRGTIFRLQPDGTLAVLHAFSETADQSYPDGAHPRGGLILGSDGYIYGTTSAGGANGNGTIFRIGRDGGLATLQSFAQDGFAPTKGRLLETAPGVFYGTAPSASGGVVYQLNVDGALLAEGRLLATDEDQPLNGVLTATGAGPSAVFSLLTNGRLGVATIVDPATGAFTYTPNPNANGTDIFTFSVTDGPRQSNIATVTVRITEVNDAPVALDSSISTAENTPVQGTLSASDPDSSSFRFTIVDNPTKGTVELTSFTNVFTYTPSPGASGADSFTFRVSDFGLESNTATVSITIVPTRLAISLDAPVGGEKLFAGIPTAIQWTVTGAIGIDVEFSRDGGRSFAPIAACAGLPSSSASCTWTPTGPPTPKARIRVVAHNAAGEHVSDVTDNLRVSVASPRVKLVFPHTRVGLETGTTQTIWWTHNLGERSFVRLELSRDGGAGWEVIEPAIQNVTAHVGAFNWLVTGPATMTAILRVTSLSTGAFDVSNRPFRVLMPTSLEWSSRR
jgi:uncharacterized repeat protein (TIGR03803 family)